MRATQILGSSLSRPWPSTASAGRSVPIAAGLMLAISCSTLEIPQERGEPQDTDGDEEWCSREATEIQPDAPVGGTSPNDVLEQLKSGVHEITWEGRDREPLELSAEPLWGFACAVAVPGGSTSLEIPVTLSMKSASMDAHLVATVLGDANGPQAAHSIQGTDYYRPVEKFVLENGALPVDLAGYDMASVNIQLSWSEGVASGYIEVWASREEDCPQPEVACDAVRGMVGRAAIGDFRFKE